MKATISYRRIIKIIYLFEAKTCTNKKKELKNLSVECRRSNCYWCWLNYQLACSGFFSFFLFFTIFLFVSLHLCDFLWWKLIYIGWTWKNSHWWSSVESFTEKSRLNSASSLLSFCTIHAASLLFQRTAKVYSALQALKFFKGTC